MDDSIGALLRAARPDAIGALVPEQLCGGRISVERRLGSGGMGTVYAARDNSQPVAVKTLNHFGASDIYRLKTEFRRLSELVHPNLVMVYELFNEGELWYFTMELVEGESLDHYWRRLRGRNKDALRQLMLQLIEGVCAIHEAGLLHRDIKPSNIMVESSGRVVVLDFGLVSGQNVGSEGLTVGGQVCGTPAYMAPEQLLGKSLGPETDWYAVGAVLYELLAERRAFSGALGEIVAEKQQARVPLLSQTVVDDQELADLCAKLLSVEPDARPSSQQLLARARAWTPTGAPAPSGPTRAGTHSKIFIGRSNELRQLDDAYRRALRGIPTLVWIHGPSGIGKTQLVAGFADYLASIEQPVVLQGRCFEREAVPHKAFDSVIDHLSRLASSLPNSEVAQLVPRHAFHVAKLFPVLRRIRPIDELLQEQKVVNELTDILVQKRRGIAGFKDLLHRLAERRPLIVVLDDMHWADEESFTLLAELLRPPDPPPMLIIAMSLHAPEAGRFEAEATVTLELAAMPEREARELALRLADAEDHALEAADLTAIVAQGEGLPLYLTELVKARRLSPDASLGVSLRGLFEQRIKALATEPRELLDLIAAAGRALPTAWAKALCSGGVERSVRVLRKELLIRERTIAGASYIELTHDHVSSVVSSLCSPERATQLHLAIGESLLDVGDRSEWLVSQLLLAGQRSAAAEHAAVAARGAMSRLAFRTACELLELALTQTDLTDASIFELRLEYARALSFARRSDEAAVQFLHAAQLADTRAERTPLLAQAATQWIRAGYLQEGMAELRGVLESVGIRWPKSSLTALGGFLLQRARMSLAKPALLPSKAAAVEQAVLEQLEALTPASTVLGAFDYALGAYFSALAFPLALRSGHSRFLLNALATEAIYCVMLGGQADSAKLERFTDAIRKLQLPTQEKAYYDGVRALVDAMSAYWCGRWHQVVAAADLAETTFEDQVPGCSWETTLMRSIRHTVVMRQHPTSVLNELPSRMNEAIERSDKYAMSDLMRTSVAAHLTQQNTEAMSRSLAALEQQLVQTPLISLEHLVASTRITVLLEERRVALARNELATAARRCKVRGLNRFPLVRAAFYGMRADVLELDDSIAPKRRAKELAKLSKLVSVEPLCFAAGLAASIAASSARLEGNAERAAQLQREAASAFDACGWRLSALAERIDWDPSATAAMTALGVTAPLRWRTHRRCCF